MTGEPLVLESQSAAEPTSTTNVTTARNRVPVICAWMVAKNQERLLERVLVVVNSSDFAALELDGDDVDAPARWRLG